MCLVYIGRQNIDTLRKNIDTLNNWYTESILYKKNIDTLKNRYTQSIFWRPIYTKRMAAHTLGRQNIDTLKKNTIEYPRF